LIGPSYKCIRATLQLTGILSGLYFRVQFQVICIQFAQYTIVSYRFSTIFGRENGVNACRPEGPCADSVPVTGRHIDVVCAHVLTNQLRQVAFIQLHILIITDDSRPPLPPLPSSGFKFVCITDRQDIHFEYRPTSASEKCWLGCLKTSYHY